MRYPLLAVLGLGCFGCTKTVKHDVAVFDLAPGKIYQPAPAAGKYAVKVAPPGERGFDKVAATEIRVERGTVLGFDSTPTGVIAFAGEASFAMDVPAGSTIKWQAKTKKHTQFATNLRHAGQYALVGVGYLGATMVDSTIDRAIDRAVKPKSSRRTKGRQDRDKSDFSLFRDVFRDAIAEEQPRR